MNPEARFKELVQAVLALPDKQRALLLATIQETLASSPSSEAGFSGACAPEKDRSYLSHKTYSAAEPRTPVPTRVVRSHGGFEQLASYRAASVAYNGTFDFCELYLKRYRTRTVDQMEQAARSGKQNIVEGSDVAGTSTKSELKLFGVAKGSIKELIKDYKDFLGNKKLPIWHKDSPEALRVRKLAYKVSGQNAPVKSDKSNRSHPSGDKQELSPEELYQRYYRPLIQKDPEAAANAMLCVANQAHYLLDKQLEAVEQQFLEEGGFTERLYHERKRRRNR